MRLVFAGTPTFAAIALDALIHSGHEVILVLTRPDAAAGRGMKQLSSEVKRLAQAHQLPVYQPATLRDSQVVEHIQSFGADAMVVAAYGLILPRNVIESFPYGCINIHASLLPRWRGAAPIQHALLAGDKETGVSIMRMDEGLDTGPVYVKQAITIAEDDTASSLHDKLAALGAHTIVEALEGIASGALQAQPQPLDGATYAHKITKEQADITWTHPAPQIERMIRAFNPFPGAYSRLNHQLIKVWSAKMHAGGSGDPGEVIGVADSGIVVACASGALQLTELQRQGGRRLLAAEFLRGFPIEPGQRFIA